MRRAAGGRQRAGAFHQADGGGRADPLAPAGRGPAARVATIPRRAERPAVVPVAGTDAVTGDAPPAAGAGAVPVVALPAALPAAVDVPDPSAAVAAAVGTPRAAQAAALLGADAASGPGVFLDDVTLGLIGLRFGVQRVEGKNVLLGARRDIGDRR